MKRIKHLLFSTHTMVVLLFLFGASMAVATFIENEYDTNTAKSIVYNSIWFELLMFWLIIIFVKNIKTYKLTKREKWPVLIFHLAFIFMFIGGAITRYISFEGIMPIEEGSVTNEIISDLTYFKLVITDGNKTLEYDKRPYLMSYLNSKDIKWPFKKKYQRNYRFGDKVITLKSLDYIPMAKDSIEWTNNGKKIVNIVTVGQTGRVNSYISEGEIKNINGAIFSFNKQVKGVINLNANDSSSLSIKFPKEAFYISMEGQQRGNVSDTLLFEQNTGRIVAHESSIINHRALYSIDNVSFVIPESYSKGKIVYYSGNKNIPEDKALMDLIQLEVSSGKEKDTVLISGGRGVTELSKTIRLNGLNVSLGFGSKILFTDFYLRCDDFLLERYPGSSSPSSYESNITIIDDGKETPHHIYMNNVMDYRGYRFFQASYFPDESGTVLSVNADYWGTTITYIGYFMLFTGMLFTLFWKKTHFWKLNNLLKRMKNKTTVTVLLLLVLVTGFNLNTCYSQNDSVKSFEVENKTQLKPKPDSQFAKAGELNSNNLVEQTHAKKFGKLLVQDINGRIKPANTHTLELLRKIYKKDYFQKGEENISSDQWFISMQIDPSYWANEFLIKVSEKGGEKLNEETGSNIYGYTSYSNLVNPNTGGFILESQYFDSFNKPKKDRSNYDNAVIEVTERFNIFSNIAFGYYTKVVPVKNDSLNTWRSWIYNSEDNPVEIDNDAYLLLTNYFDSVKEALKSDSWKSANDNIDIIFEYQQTWGKDIIPSDLKVGLEILYNRLNIFFWLMIAYCTLGLLLLISGFTEVSSIKSKYKLYTNLITKVLLGITLTAFIIQIVALGIRWYISGHAPWSNGYEAIIFISGIGVFSGLILYKNRNAFIPAAGLLVAAIMMGFAHGGSMLDPQITPLEPVLKSYWLMIHVGIITSSYGFFGLSAILSVISLILYGSKSTEKILHSIKELTTVNEISLTIGIFALTIGTFLGGIWANESWGRYWSWDPKETWAFISIIIYAVVLHLRLVPKFRDKLFFNIASLWAIWSIIFTYFGVNYYLSGLHSYAAGDPIPIPNWIYITVIGMLGLSIFAYIKVKKIKILK